MKSLNKYLKNRTKENFGSLYQELEAMAKSYLKQEGVDADANAQNGYFTNKELTINAILESLGVADDELNKDIIRHQICNA
jgi:hypothetical protein